MAETKKTVTVASKAKTTSEKSAAKPKTTTKKTASPKTTAKKTPKKLSVTIDTICKKVEQMLPKTTAIQEKIAVDIEVWGFEDGSNAKMYIEIKNGKVTVSPYTYNEKDFRVAVSFVNVKNYIDGKLSFKDMLASSEFYAEGNIIAALKMSAIF